MANADVNQDGKVNDADALMILKSLVDLATLPQDNSFIDKKFTCYTENACRLEADRHFPIVN